MIRKLATKKGSNTTLLIILLLLSCAVFMGLKIITDNIARKKIPGSSIIYIPSGKYLKFVAFGHTSFLADLIYLWSIQYFSTPSIENRFEVLDHTFSIIAELDPHYLDPYEIGALIAIYDAGDLDTALKILDKGFERNPEQWIFPYQAGHYAQMVAKDFELARKYYKKTMEVKGAPPIASRLYANAAFKLGDAKSAWQSWLEVYQTAEAANDERVKKIATNHLYQVKARIDIENIKKAIKEFKERYGHYPSDLDRLVRSGFLDSIPKDFDGKDYLYDSKKGKVQPPTIPWKR